MSSTAQSGVTASNNNNNTTTAESGVKNEETKTKDRSASTHVTLKVKGQDEESLREFRMRKDGEMRKVMESYNKARGVEWDTFVFLSEDGSRIREYHTPDQLELKDGDQIDAMLHQISGFGPFFQ